VVKPHFRFSLLHAQCTGVDLLYAHWSLAFLEFFHGSERNNAAWKCGAIKTDLRAPQF